MKRLLIIVALTAFACTCYGQKLAKANLLSIKIMEIQVVEGKSLENSKPFICRMLFPLMKRPLKD